MANEENRQISQVMTLLEDTNSRVKAIAEVVTDTAKAVSDHTDRLERIEEKLDEVESLKTAIVDHSKRIRVLESR